MKNWAEQVLKQTGSLLLTKFDSPVEATLERVFRLGWWASDESRPAIQVEAIFGADWERTLMYAHQEGGQLRLGSDESGALWAQVHCLARAAAVLRTLPDQTALELAIAGPHPMRARGRMIRGRFWVEEIHPSMERHVLVRALELSRQAEEDDVFEAASEELAQAAEASLREEWSMDISSSPNLERDGKILRVKVNDDDIRSWMLMFGGHLMVHDDEFCQVWGLQKERAELEAESVNPFAALGAQISQAVNQSQGIVATHLIHEGKRSKYRLSDIRQSNWLRSEEVDLTDTSLATLGFAPIGDLVVEAFAGVVLRAYACPEGDCWAVVNSGINYVYIREFFSYCSDGTRLTTTTLPFSEGQPEKKLYKQSYPELSWEELLQAHRAEMRRQGWHPQPCPKDLVSLAASIDDYLLRAGQ